MVKKLERLEAERPRGGSVAVPEVAPYNFQTAHDAVAGVRTEQEAVMDWARILAYVTGTVDQELLYAGQAQPYSELKCLDP